MADATTNAKNVHTWSIKLQRPAAEHFVTFLYSTNHFKEDYSLSKKELYRALHDEYQPYYHWNKPPFGVLSVLLKCKLVKRAAANQDHNIIMFNTKKIIPVINKLKKSFENGIAPPLNERLTQPVETVVVSQQTSFRPRQQRMAGLTHLKCDICQVTFSSNALLDTHKNEELHRLRMMYRNDKKSLCTSKELSIYADESAIGLEFCVIRPGQRGTMKLYITNSSTNVRIVDGIIPLVDVPEVEMRHTEVPVTVLPGTKVPLLLVYNFVSGGSYLYPLVLRVTQTASDVVYILKEIIFDCQSEMMDDLKPVSKFKRAVPHKFVVSEGEIVTGVPPPPTRTGLVMERPLRQYSVQIDLQTLLNHGLKVYPNIKNNMQLKLKELKSLLGLDEEMKTVSRRVPQADNYCQLYSTLLHIEEHQMNIDIRNYDCDGQVLTKVDRSTLLALDVPGLAERRPSVLRGDSIFVIFEHDPKKVRYEGRVHNIRETKVELGFHHSFCNKYVDGMKLHVQFKFNRYPLQVEHRALDILGNCDGARWMLPKRSDGKSNSVVPIRVWKNRNLENNEQQMKAVTNIVNNTAYPAPYIVFGPPGTGKTVTIVEAIVQLWDLHKKRHILVCTPSNAAADVIAQRLLNYVPSSSLLRLYASSHSFNAVPDDVRKCSNFDGGSLFYPTKDKIMTYPIVIVTLITAGKLVGANIPAGHFSHVFIDECGHAIEPEVLAPIAGLLISDDDLAGMMGQLVLAGDPKQLGPILRSPLAIDLGLGMSFLERLMEDEELYKRRADTEEYDSAVLTKLVKNYRSHESILAVPNSLFYDGELQVCGGPEISLACSWEELPKKKFPVIFHGVVGRDDREASSPSFFNVQEIDVVLGYLDKLFHDRLNGRQIRPKDVGIVTPYRKQVEKMKTALRKKQWSGVDVGSVEQFQGQERLIIIISTVRSSQKFVPDDYKFQLGFLKNPKRLNVALTRAKALLVVVGNPNILQCDVHWRTFIKYCQNNGAYRGVRFVPISEDETSAVDGLVNGVAHLRLNSGENSMQDDGPNWRGEI